jgi:AcrR family transcriptional regulator
MAALESAPNGDAWGQRRILASLRIERAGLQLMVERGLDDVTVEMIAKEAGISVRTFFRYFRNPREVLTAVPIRESRRMCEALLARPPGESLVDGFHVWFREDHGPDLSTPAGALEAETMALWSRIVQEAPELIQTESHVLLVLGANLEAVVRARLGLGSDDDEKVGVLSVALAAVIWYVYTRSLLQGNPEALMARLDEAFDLLDLLHSRAAV